MGRLLVIALVVWVALAVLGFVIKGLFWLAVVGIVLFIATSIWGFIQRRSSGAGV